MRKLKKQTIRRNLLAVLTVGFASAFAAAQAGTMSDPKDAKEMKMMPPSSMLEPKDWTLELGSGVTFSNIRTSSDRSYTIVPIQLTASLKLDDIGNEAIFDGIFRGYTEFYFRGDYDEIVHGPEHHFEGLMFGPRYNFVQPGWKIIPFIEGGVGFDFADSNPDGGGLGQDFNFTFNVAAGAKYQICDDWFLRLSAEYQHLSNAGLSEPAHPNRPIDALGPKLSVGYAF